MRHQRRKARLAPPLLPLLLATLLATSAQSLEPSDYFVNTTLRCCTLPMPPVIIERNGTDAAVGGDEADVFGDFGGIAIKYLRLLSEQTGLNCSSLVKYNHESRNGTDLDEVEGAAAKVRGGNEFDNFVAKMNQCTVPGQGVINKSDDTCTCDIGIGGWAINEKRLGLVSFLPPFIFDNFMVVTHVDNTIPDAGVFFLRTFDFNVWITIFALVVVFTFLKFLDADFSPWSKDEPPADPAADDPDTTTRAKASGFRRFLAKGRVPFRLRKAFQSTVGHMTGAPNAEIDGEFGSFRMGLLNFIIFLCGLFLVLIYGSSMTASIVQESFGSDYRNVNDFKLCRIPTSEVCLLGGDGVELFWNQSIARLDCHREEGFIPPRVFQSENYTDALEAVANQGDDGCKYLVGLGSTLRYGIQEGKFCGSLVFTGEPFFAEGVSFVLPHRSNLTYRLSRATLALKNRDAVQTVHDFFEDDEGCLPERPKSLTFKKLRWFFYLAYGACGLLFIAMVFDRRRAPAARRRRRRREHSDSDDEDDNDGDDGERGERRGSNAGSGDGFDPRGGAADRARGERGGSQGDDSDSGGALKGGRDLARAESSSTLTSQPMSGRTTVPQAQV